MNGPRSPREGLDIPTGSGVAYGIYAPNAPTLIAPHAFRGPFQALAEVSAATARDLRALRVTARAAPDALFVVSPHFLTRDGIRVQASERPKCIHDFSGMPPEVSKADYSPPGHPALARELVKAGRKAGLSIDTTEQWGLDHGAWSALMHLLPEATVPVVPVSITSAPLERFVSLGEAIHAAARQSGLRIAVVGTGSIVHNFDFFGYPAGTGPWPDALRIERAVSDRVVRGDVEGLLQFDRADWSRVQPEGNAAPLLAVIGAMAKGYRARLVSDGASFGLGGFSTFEFAPPP